MDYEHKFTHLSWNSGIPWNIFVLVSSSSFIIIDLMHLHAREGHFLCFKEVTAVHKIIRSRSIKKNVSVLDSFFVLYGG